MRHYIFGLLFCLVNLLVNSPAEALGQPTYSAGIRAMSPPFSFLAIKDGKQVVRGYSVDELAMLGKVMGARIEFRAVNELDKRAEMLRAGSVDVLAHESEQKAKELDAEFIPIGISLHHHLYVNSNCRSVTCLRDLSFKKVAGILAAPYSKEIVFSGDVLWLNSPMEALNLVSQGVVDVYVAPSERVADYLIDKYQIPNILKKGVELGKTPLGLLVSKRRPELAVKIRAALGRLQETGMVAQLHDKWFGKPTIYKDFKLFAKYIAIGSGVAGVIFVIIVIWNVSLKRRVERVTMDLRRTEERYRDLIESSPDMIFLVTERGRVLHANERVHSFLKFPEQKDELNLKQFVTRDYVDEISAFLNKVFNDGCDKHELVMLGAAGQPIEVEVAGRIVQGSERTQLLACLFARSVSERNRMEEELIQSERLGIIGKMAASLAHEINNPLSVIQANAEDLMYEADFSTNVMEGLQAIQRNAVRAGEITKGLLEAASPKPVSMDTIEVGALVYDALSLLGAGEQRQRVSVDIPDVPLYIHGDDRVLQQVLLNLVFNSLAATSENGSIIIRVDAKGHGYEETVRIEVSDTGMGIERKNLTQIFEPFFSSRKGGFGLGLFITRRMVERLDGLIFAESEPGEGTSMYMEFPAIHHKEK